MCCVQQTRLWAPCVPGIHLSTLQMLTRFLNHPRGRHYYYLHSRRGNPDTQKMEPMPKTSERLRRPASCGAGRQALPLHQEAGPKPACLVPQNTSLQERLLREWQSVLSTDKPCWVSKLWIISYGFLVGLLGAAAWREVSVTSETGSRESESLGERNPRSSSISGVKEGRRINHGGPGRVGCVTFWIPSWKGFHSCFHCHVGCYFFVI